LQRTFGDLELLSAHTAGWPLPGAVEYTPHLDDLTPLIKMVDDAIGIASHDALSRLKNESGATDL